MSRSGYSDDGDDNWSAICWRGAVASALRGKRGQAFLRELLGAMDAMPEKRLIMGELEADGEFCTLGVVATARGLDVSDVTFELGDTDILARRLGIAQAMVQEIVYMNDEYPYNPLNETPEKRWQRMRQWVSEQIRSQP